MRNVELLQGAKEQRKANSIGYSWRGKCFLKLFVEGTIKERTEVAGRRVRRRKQACNWELNTVQMLLRHIIIIIIIIICYNPYAG